MVEQDEIDARAREIRTWYEGYVFKCQLYREKFEAHLNRAIVRQGLLDARVESRAKSIERVCCTDR